MKSAALVAALLAMVAGAVGLTSPDRLISIGRYVVTPAGLYGIAALRVAVGLVLLLVAPVSRLPRTLRVIGVIVLIAGLATPLFGVQRARAVLDWEAAQGTVLIRVVAGLVLAIGGFLAFAVSGGHRPVNGAS